MLEVYTLEQSEQWDKIVRSFKNYDVYYLSGYVKAFEIHGDGQPLLFYYFGKEGEEGLRGINVVMERDISHDLHFRGVLEEDKYYDFSTPYGYGGWLIENTGCINTAPLFTSYERWCMENDIVSEFVRYHPMLENYRDSEKYYQVIPLGETVAMELTSPEDIWKNMSSKNKNHIRKSMKSGVKIYNGRYPEAYEKFREIYNSTMDKDKAEKYYYFEPEFYQSVLDDLRNEAQVFYAQLPGGEIIASAIMLGTNGYMNYHLSGSVRKYSSLAPTNLLLARAAEWGCANGFKTLYLGGGVGSREDSLFKYKRAFYKGDLYKFHIGKKILNTEIYEYLMKIRDIAGENIPYFPEYRA